MPENLQEQNTLLERYCGDFSDIHQTKNKKDFENSVICSILYLSYIMIALERVNLAGHICRHKASSMTQRSFYEGYERVHGHGRRI
jgi:hypothetical protein